MLAVEDLIEVSATDDKRVHVDTQGDRYLGVRGAYAFASRIIDAAAKADGGCPWEPFLDQVIVHVIEESERKQGGVHIPDTVQNDALRGTVLAVGPGKWEDGKHVKIEGVKPGDIVTFSRHAGTITKVGDRSYLCMKQTYILAVIPTGVTQPVPTGPN